MNCVILCCITRSKKSPSQSPQMRGVLTVVESHVGFSVALFLLIFLTHQLKGREGGRRGRGGEVHCLHLTNLGIVTNLQGSWVLCQETGGCVLPDSLAPCGSHPALCSCVFRAIYMFTHTQLNIYQPVVQGEQINLGQLPLPCSSLGWLRLSYVCVALRTECVVSVLIVFTHRRLVALSALCGEWEGGG